VPTTSSVKEKTVGIISREAVLGGMPSPDLCRQQYTDQTIDGQALAASTARRRGFAALARC
jgi:hypothetical protein